MATHNNYDLLLGKLDEFIRKYYINSAIRGLLYATGLILLSFLVISLLESQFYFGGGTRKLLWYGFLVVSLLAVGAWILLPLGRYFRLGSTISHERAAEIIGRHFGNVKDKLLNVLQLRRQAGSGGDNALLLASIDQKSAEISPVPFRTAIDLTQNRRYLKYALPPLLILLVILFAAPSLIKDSTDRLIRNSEHFERPAPFTFRVPGDLEVVQFDNFPLTVTIEGDVLPAEAYIEVEGYRYRLNRENGKTFTYDFNNVREDTPFRLSAGEVTSTDHTLRILPKPSIAGFTVHAEYPGYLGRRDEDLSNIGDLTVPVGTRLRWSFDTENTDNINLRFASEDTTGRLRRDGTDLYSFDRRILRNDRYTLYVGNSRLPLGDSVTYALSVIPDQYPQISVESFRDSTEAQLTFFVGEASDDHGIRKIDFVYRRLRQGGESEEQRLAVVGSGSAGKQIRYDHVFDLKTDVELEPGDELTYYFEVFDNDGVNGSKSAKTPVMVYREPTREEMEARAESNDNKVKDQLRQALDATRDLQDDTKRLREKMLQEKDVDWKLKKEVEKLAERQREIQQKIEEAKQAFEENQQNESQENEQVRQKEQKLQEMFEKSVSEELQQLMAEIQQLMEELNKDQTLEKMEEMELSDEEAEAKLERMLELFKQLEVEKDMQDAIEKLEELAQEQEKLAEETEEGEKSTEELQQEQQQLQEDFEKLQEKLDQAEQKNEALERPMPLDTKQEEQEEVQQDMQDAQQKMQEQKPSDAAKKQQDASQKMKKMAQQMEENMQSMQMESNKEDMAAIRQLLENLVDLSFDQEATMDELNQTTINTPRYVELVQQQFQINGDFELVQDSLQALAKRNFQIETFVTEKVTEIKGNLSGTVTELEERRTPQAANLQQRAMTGLNDLALMLSESMEQMQQQMAGQMQGQQQCQNPQNTGQGKEGGKPSENPGSDGQKSIGQEMREMKEGLQKGEGGTSKEFAELAARQAALRRALEEKQKELQQGGEGKNGQLQELIDEMNAAEEDLVNKRLTNESLMRQQDILTRMLEHERAEREQKMDEQRKSETAEQQRRELPPNLEEYIRQRRAEVERFRRVTPQLKPYYQGLVNEYFRSLGAE
ncbi:DUF4175 family protein [Lewinella sp. JB7]|uniref:DUF4175 family protein n=1 Tax=Lewinella sp. JB7 TaxID=2962887 RepID=UPI0020C93AA7|nr:DUF4175 family protein [Lewinella sp. JB7]MCP9237391.1 DUF4175 domain-containing protein [Lewinella sp. JB7]